MYNYSGETMKIRYLLILLVIFLVGCAKIEVNQDKFVTEMDKKLGNMVEISKQELTNYYGVDTDKFNSYVFKISREEPTNIYVLVLPSNNKEAKKEINKFFDKLSSNCSKSCVKRIKDKYSNSLGDYLFYIVSDDNKEIYKVMKEYSKVD